MMTANAEIILEEHKNVLQIPEGAIIYDKDKKASVEVPDPKAKEGKEEARGKYRDLQRRQDRTAEGLERRRPGSAAIMQSAHTV